jgi:hypothetical protein
VRARYAQSNMFDAFARLYQLAPERSQTSEAGEKRSDVTRLARIDTR